MENKYLVEGRAEQSPPEINLIEGNSISPDDHKSYFWEGYENNKDYCLLQTIESNSSELKKIFQQTIADYITLSLSGKISKNEYSSGLYPLLIWSSSIVEQNPFKTMAEERARNA